MDGVLEFLSGIDIWNQAVTIWDDGGWAMYALAGISLVMFGVGMNVFLLLREKRFRSVPESAWRDWIVVPSARTGPIGEILNFVLEGKDLKGIGKRFEQIREKETLPVDRELRVMKVCVSAAPLVGLLGTVTGMLSTFGALASGTGGEKTMAMVAKGISEALITTETGLVIALPGVFFQYQLSRTQDRYKAFLTHLETVCTQSRHQEVRAERKRRIDRLARAEIARMVLNRLKAQPVGS